MPSSKRSLTAIHSSSASTTKLPASLEKMRFENAHDETDRVSKIDQLVHHCYDVVQLTFHLPKRQGNI